MALLPEEAGALRALPVREGNAILSADRARRGASGALDPQSALAGLNSLPRSGPLGLPGPRGVDGWVPRGEVP